MTAEVFRFISKAQRDHSEDAVGASVDWVQAITAQSEFDTLISLPEQDRPAYAAQLRAKYGDKIAISGPGIPDDAL